MAGTRDPARGDRGGLGPARGGRWRRSKGTGRWRYAWVLSGWGRSPASATCRPSPATPGSCSPVCRAWAAAPTSRGSACMPITGRRWRDARPMRWRSARRRRRAKGEPNRHLAFAIQRRGRGCEKYDIVPKRRKKLWSEFFRNRTLNRIFGRGQGRRCSSATAVAKDGRFAGSGALPETQASSAPAVGPAASACSENFR